LLTPASHAWVCAAEQAQGAQPEVLVDETTQVMCARNLTDVHQPLVGTCYWGGKEREEDFSWWHLEELSRKVIGNTTESCKGHGASTGICIFCLLKLVSLILYSRKIGTLLFIEGKGMPCGLSALQQNVGHFRTPISSSEGQAKSHHN